MKKGVLISKLQSLEETLNEIRLLGKVRADLLCDDWRTRRAVERDLQIAVETVIDVCQRIIALHHQSPAATSAQAIERCVQLGVLSGNVAYEKMAQFRNFVVHRYDRIDVEILAEIVNNRLADFERFRDEVIRFYESKDSD
ncbi:MAG: DUF86 domain-containing protein [Verrucomicrobiota bacterium]|nr:DUF86 domain-containing protein [Verrucomicrobiota bacterium]